MHSVRNLKDADLNHTSPLDQYLGTFPPSVLCPQKQQALHFSKYKSFFIS